MAKYDTDILEFSGPCFPEMDVDCWRFITR
jgi:hypothetical protein